MLYNLICSKAVPEVIAEEGGVGVRTRVGHSFIKQTMAETGAVFGGEHSGHYYYRDNYRADSGIITAFIVLELMSISICRSRSSLGPFIRYAESGEINTQVRRPPAHRRAVRGQLEAEGVAVDQLDGLTADYGTWWFNLRPSNTEPLLRLNVEAKDEESLRQTRGSKCSSLLKELRLMPLDDFLLDLLEDPVDHGTLLYVPSKDVLYNPRLQSPTKCATPFR